MTWQGWLQIALFAALIIAAIRPLGGYMARVIDGGCTPLQRVLGPFETAIYRLAGVDPAEEQTWPAYATGLLEGKELRFGVSQSALFATVTTASSDGAVDAMHDSFMPLSGLVLLANMMLDEVIVGGPGSGLFGMLLFAVVAVFVAGLMIGRTPEYLGKKIEANKIKMTMLVLLTVPAFILILGRSPPCCQRASPG